MLLGICSTSGTYAGLESVIFEVRVFRKKRTRLMCLHSSTQETRTTDKNSTDPLRAPQQKKQCGEANKNKVTRILVCPGFFGMPWDLLKLTCAQDLGLRLTPVLGARKKQQIPRRASAFYRMPTIAGTEKGRGCRM